MTTHVQKFATDKEAREHLRAQLAEYLAGQPESTRSAHKWMRRGEAAGMGILLAAFLAALYVSVAWNSLNPMMIPVAWFFFATTISLVVVLFGLHTILIRAYPPVILPGKVQRFVSGSGAVWTGVASILGGLIMAGLWVAFAYSTATFNLAMIAPLTNALGILMGIGMLVSIVVAIYQKTFRSR